MCRHVGYLGPPVSLEELLLRPTHSLREQTWAPSDMRSGGTVNVDGFGVGWYPAGSDVPTRYRAADPMWTDASFTALASTVSSPAIVGAVRSAMVGTPVVPTACAPFGDGHWLFSHNGRVSGWPESLACLAEKLDPVDLMTLDAPVDSAVVWALLRHRLRRGQPAEEAVCDVLLEIVAAAPESRMNLLLTDGTVLIATTWTHSLFVRRDRGAVTVASEPFGDGTCSQDPGEGGVRWEEVPDHHLLVANTDHVALTALPESGAS
ncbi:glutamine amidotransferase [Halopolyspora algeriensis]|uniref:Gamma-glutamyl-hercynylcysteine sulfoxide hydrolase n=1 Tax=Halopolyspora algeriensis TaxID=1500506 RepID=A0A368VVS8_9ACTN|nr:ergothioneine biosynthesis protein EgtC [Halopolyspora algeriensis]RCW45985.1 glutamine amidotransferase [Halopolyspora algeriensis]TQM55398.1 glutamine amidotransferase [Halopolyspora algeriensis]